MPRPKQQQPAPAPVAPLAFSYQRWSSPAQSEGDSRRRQDELRDAWVKKSGAVLDTTLTLRDEGVSGFSGTHRDNPDRHALAGFLEMVKRGRVPRGSYFILESLDRLTREHIRPALTLLLNLIDAGVRVVQLLPVETVYDENVEPMSLMMAIMELSRGHSESRMKSERLGRVWAEKKRKAAADGTPLTRRTPAWVRVKGKGFELIPRRADAVRRIFAMAAAGHGLGAITKTLNAEKVPAIGRAEYWARSYVFKLLTSRAAFGEYQPHKGHNSRDREPDGPPVRDYFPPVITEDEWHAAQAALAGRKKKGGRPTVRVNVFSGLIKDARDGGPLHSVNKGEKSSGPMLVPYNAANGLGDVKYVTFPFTTFEAAVFSQLREIDPREILPRHDATADRAAVLAGKQAELEGRVEKIKAQLIAGGDLAPLVDVLRVVDRDLSDVNEQLAAVRREAAHPLSEAWGECQSLAAAVENSPDPDETRVRLRAALRRMVEGVWCLFVARGPLRLAAVQMWFAGGACRSYLIAHAAGRANAASSRPASWSVRSFSAAGLPGGADLRDPAAAAKLEQLLLKHLDRLAARRP